MNKLKWKLQTFDDIDYNNINPHLLLCDMLKFRGIKNPEAWLEVTEENENEPSLLKNVDEATDLMRKAMAYGKRIYVQVDS